MTRPALLVAAAVAIAVAFSVAGHHAHRNAPPTEIATDEADARTVSALASAFVLALTDVDHEHPHGDNRTLRRYCTRSLVEQLRTTTALPATQLATGIEQHAAISSVAIHVDNAHEDDVALVTALLVDAVSSRVVMRSASTYTVTLQRVAGHWVVVGVTA